MTELLQQILAWVSLHPGWSYSVIFLVAMAESLAIVGLIVPGVVIMFGIGALIASGAIAFWPAMGWAVVGAVAGDGLSFWLGRHYQERLSAIWPFSRYPESIHQGKRFFEKYGGKSVALGRFFGPIRAVIPLVAGMMGMTPLRFLFANVLSALAWAPLYLLPGMVFGASMELASEVAMRLVILLLLLLLILWLAYHITRGLFRRLHPHTSQWVQWLLNWGKAHPIMGEIANALADPNHPETRGLSILATLLLITSGLFILILGLVPNGTHQGIDMTVLQALQSLRSPWADQLMVYFTRLADIGVIYPLTAGVLLLLLATGQRRTAGYWFAAGLFCLIASPLLKFGLQIARPEIVHHSTYSFSFPSGHTLWATVLYGFLSVLIARPLSDRWRWLPYTLAGLVIMAVALSRLYLGVHWLSDVAGSITLGLAWVSLLGLAYHRHAAQAANWRSLSLASIIILSIAFSVESSLHLHYKIAEYDPIHTVMPLAASAWWQGDTKEVPTYRGDLRDREDHPLNLQFAGSIHWLEAQLMNSGWQRKAAFFWTDGLRLLSPSQSLQELPILPQVHEGRYEALLLVKHLADDRRLVLRLWESGFQLDSKRPLWIGNVSEQQQQRLLGTLTFAETGPAFGQALGLLGEDLKQLDSNQWQKSGSLIQIREQP